MAGEQYYSVFTEQGLALLREAIQHGTKLGITEMSFGDGNGSLPVPSANFTKLVNEVYRTQLNSLAPDPNNKNWLRAEAIIASAIGGFNIRELGLWAGNVLVAYSNYPPTYKPNPSDGTARIMTFRMILQIDNTANFELKIDADIVMATIRTVEEAKQEAIDHADKTKVTLVSSIQELLNIEVWEARTVYLKSYEEGQNLGGDTFVYKATRQLENDGVSVFYGWERQKNSNIFLIEDAGYTNATQDSSEIIKRIMNLSKVKHISIDFGSDRDFLLENSILTENSKGITALGRNVKIKLKNNSDTTGFTTFDIKTIGEALVLFDGVSIDGSNTPQDLFANTEYYKTPRMNGFDIYAKNIILRNIKMSNWYGYASRYFDYKNILLENIDINNVGGHWYLNNDFDAFADAFYFGRRSGDVKVIMNNIRAEAKMKDTTLSRCGITIENLSDQIDEKFSLIGNNVLLKNFDRVVHIESNKGIIDISLNTSELFGNVIFFSFANVIKPQISINNKTKVSFFGQTYSGSVGLAKECSVVVNNSEIDCKNLPTSGLPSIAQAASDVSILNNSIVKNISGLISENSSVFAQNSRLEFTELNNEYYFWQSKAEFDTCSLVNIDSTKIKNMSAIQTQPVIKNCDVKNLSFNQNCYHKNKSRLYLDSSLNGYSQNIFDLSSADIYVDEKLFCLSNDLNLISDNLKFSDLDQIVLEADYYVNSPIPLLNAPASFSEYQVQVKILNKPSKTLMQTVVNIVDGSTKKRIRNNMIWGAWS